MPRTDLTCPSRMMRTTWPPQFMQVGLDRGEGTRSLLTVYTMKGSPWPFTWCSISYPCSQPYPHFMQANEYASCTVCTAGLDGAVGMAVAAVGAGAGVSAISLMPAPLVPLVHCQWTPLRAGAHQALSSVG